MRVCCLLLWVFLIAACRPINPVVKRTTIFEPTTNAAKPIIKDLPTDSAYEKFIDSFLYKGDVVFSKKKVEAGQFMITDKDGAFVAATPARFYFGNTFFYKKDICHENAESNFADNLDERFLDIDTAFLFSFKGRKYGWAYGDVHNCNGTGCLVTYQFLADFQFHRLHVFESMAVPFNFFYFGSITQIIFKNHMSKRTGDDDLDFLLPAIINQKDCGGAYCETNLVALTPFHLNSKGYFEQLAPYKVGCVLFGEYNNGLSPRNFKITGVLNWMSWYVYREREK